MTNNQHRDTDNKSLTALLASMEAELELDDSATEASLATLVERRRHYRNLLLAQAFGERYPN